ncbi:MAG TPA: aldo/keto reductase, partial [Gaiellaceae bacterium]|nr:aldo/keto reductase [Gaiellaceae bacterium]
MAAEPTTQPAAAAGTVRLGELTVNRMGFGAMRLTGAGVWGNPVDREGAKAVLRRAVELGVTLIDTAAAYGPEVHEELSAE